MKKINILIIILFFSSVTLATESKPKKKKGALIQSLVSGWNLGSLGWYFSKAKSSPFDNLPRSERRCYQQYNAFDVEQWHIEIGTPCRESERIGRLLSANDFARYKNYQNLFIKIKPFIEYVFDERVELNLRLILADERGFEKSKFAISFRKKYFPLYVINQFSGSDNDSQKINTTMEVSAVSEVAHEFFHRYAHKFLTDTAARRKTIYDRQSNEALATSIEACAAFALDFNHYDDPRNSHAMPGYQQGLTAEDAFWAGAMGQAMKEQLNEQQIQSKKIQSKLVSYIGYVHGNYQIWNKFGTDIDSKDREKISKMMKYCKYLVHQVPNIEQLHQITEQQYQQMPAPEFLLDQSPKNQLQ